MSTVSSTSPFSQVYVWPEDGNNDPPEEATEAGLRHVATAEIS